MPGHPLPRAELSRASELVGDTLGLHFPETRWRDLQRGLAAAARDLGYRSVEDCLRGLLESPPSVQQTELLAEHLTVGETYFFREKEMLDLFEQRILPDLLRAATAGEQRLRIWSAGCCTGEEPYSIAMLLDRVIPDRSGWDISIRATDVNPHFLRKARRGVYGEWSFRQTPETIRNRYFRKKGKRQWELDPVIRSLVTYSSANLAQRIDDPALRESGGMDVIFCRNVLMYFSPGAMQQAVRTFYELLRPGGWLLVGVTETLSPAFVPFEPIHCPGGTLYRKSPAVVAGPSPLPFQPGEERRTSQSTSVATPPRLVTRARERRVGQPERRQIVRRIVAEHSQTHPDSQSQISSAGELVSRARRAAGEGKLTEAAELCERAVAADKMSAGPHFLLATIEQERGESEAAERSLRRALYLDDRFVLAHFTLANLETGRDKTEEAARHLRNALRTLDAYAPDDLLPESDGLTAGRLREIILTLQSRKREITSAGGKVRS